MAVLFKLKEWKQTSHRFQVTLLHLNTSLSHFYTVTAAPRQAGPENNPCVSCHVSQNRQVPALWEQILWTWRMVVTTVLKTVSWWSVVMFYSHKRGKPLCGRRLWQFSQDWQMISDKQFTDNEYWACTSIVFASITLGIRWLTFFTCFSTMSMSGKSEDLGYKYFGGRSQRHLLWQGVEPACTK